MELRKWLSDPERNYTDGIEIYKTVKKTPKFDVFFSQIKTCSQGDLHFNLLERELTRIARIDSQIRNTEIQKAPPTIGVKPIVKKLDSSQTVSENKTERPKFYNDKMYNFNELPKNLQTLFKENQNITKEITATHANMKAYDSDKKYDADRAECLRSIKRLEKKRNKNWETIDTWWNGERLNPIPKTDTERAIQLGKDIEAAKKYLARYSDHKGEKQVDECKKRIAFLSENNIKWPPKKKK
jgi:hypothetical protein